MFTKTPTPRISLRNPRAGLFAVWLGLILVLAACGSDPTSINTGSDAGSGGAGEQPIPVEPDGGIGDGAEPLPDAPIGPLPDNPPPVENEFIVSENDPVDGKIVAPTAALANPDDPTELWVRFVGGDVNCTAGYVTVLTETPDEIAFELVVGITQDALTRSCLAGEFNLRIDVPLNESAEGKSISWTQPEGEEPQLVTPDLSTEDFVGLPQADAEQLADENLLTWRVTRIDGEFFAVTQDYQPGRLNFEVDDGLVTVVVLG